MQQSPLWSLSQIISTSGFVFLSFAQSHFQLAHVCSICLVSLPGCFKKAKVRPLPKNWIISMKIEWVHPLFSFGPLKRVKRLRNGSRHMIFTNWLDTRPKMGTHDPNFYPTILGGVSRGFWTPFLDRGAQSAIFWHVKTPKVPVFTCQKMALRASRSKNGGQNRKTAGRFLFMGL